MAAHDSDDTGPDLFGWVPDTGQVGYDRDAPEIRAATLDAKIAKAIALALADCPIERGQVAAEMTRYLGGERVTVHMLNAYASEAKVDHRITLARFAALVHATEDYRLLALIPELFGFAVVDAKYLPWIEIGQLQDEREAINRRLDQARRQTRRKGSRR